MTDKAGSDMDTFKDKVYTDIRWLEFWSKDDAAQFGPKTGNAGCLGFMFTTFLGGLAGFSKKKGLEHRNIPRLRRDAEDILNRPDVKEKLCEILDPSMRLPIDVAYSAVPFLYEFAGGHKEEIPPDSMLFAIICTKIAEQGVSEYCR
ncbi:MAG: hypothetical protein ABI539_14870 [Acidobacteriota bacterium]